jgi:hypothetical protein
VAALLEGEGDADAADALREGADPGVLAGRLEATGGEPRTVTAARYAADARAFAARVAHAAPGEAATAAAAAAGLIARHAAVQAAGTPSRRDEELAWQADWLAVRLGVTDLG